MAGHNDDCPECGHSYAARLLRQDDVEKGGTNAGVGEPRADVESLDGRRSPKVVFNPYYTGRPRTPVGGSKQGQLDRQEIIRQIKRGERASNGSRPTSPEQERPSSSLSRKRKSPEPRQSPLVDSQTSSRPSSSGQLAENEASGMQLERPRSALHRGDFRDEEDNTASLGRFAQPQRDEPTVQLSTSPVAPWHPAFPTAAFRHALEQRRALTKAPSSPPARPIRSRAVSNASLRTSILYQPPTSPLVQSSRPDTPEPPQRQQSRSPDKSRRHTFSPRSLQRFASTLDYPASARAPQPPGLRKENTFPYQAHQPRRSLHNFSSLPHTPAPGARRPSFSESPLHHAPMVGSYEESILRGRMSTTPSKPLNFVAQIGVLGKGDCAPKLRCPAHVTVPFPAVFYSYNSGIRAATSDQPSPYVGLVDLENNLTTVHSSPEKRRQRVDAVISDGESRASSLTREDGSGSELKAQRRKKYKQKRRSGSPKAPPGGSYRIPQQGQLQIVIKNPNKTAVKLFLVPYDLSDMEPGQKTFIRQRSYSAGPIIDMPLSSRKNFGTDRPEASLPSGEDPNDRPMLRYLVHLHICCPSKGRFFLYKSMRVVFANRVPDGKEKLRNEVQLPEPRYSAYKPGRDSMIGATSLANSSSEHRRRSRQEPPSETPPDSPWPQRRLLAQSLPNADYDRSTNYPMPSLPYHFNSALADIDSRTASGQVSDGMELDSERSQETAQALSPISSHSSEGGKMGAIAPRLEHPFNFERDHSRERLQHRNGRSESLLSKKLKDLAMQGQNGSHGD